MSLMWFLENQKKGFKSGFNVIFVGLVNGVL